MSINACAVAPRSKCSKSKQAFDAFSPNAFSSNTSDLDDALYNAISILYVERKLNKSGASRRSLITITVYFLFHNIFKYGANTAPALATQALLVLSLSSINL